MPRTPMILVLALMLGACAGSTAFDPEPVTQLAEPAAQPPEAIDQPCATPVSLPNRDMSEGEVERLWGKDRVSLRVCGGRHKANVKWRKSRDAGLAGVKDGEH